MSKPKTKRANNSAALELFEADLNLRAAAETLAESSDADDVRESLREAALAFADAWHACGSNR